LNKIIFHLLLVQFLVALSEYDLNRCLSLAVFRAKFSAIPESTGAGILQGIKEYTEIIVRKKSASNCHNL